MLLILLIGLAVLALAVGWWLTTYNALVATREGVHSASSVVAAHAQRRHDQLVEIAAALRAQFGHEAGVVRSINDAINTPAGDVGSALAKIRAIAVAYPQLAQQGVDRAIQTYDAIEQDLAAARRLSASSVQAYATLIGGFPSCLVAALHGFRAIRHFDVAPSVLQKPQVTW